MLNFGQMCTLFVWSPIFVMNSMYPLVQACSTPDKKSNNPWPVRYFLSKIMISDSKLIMDHNLCRIEDHVLKTCGANHDFVTKMAPHGLSKVLTLSNEYKVVI